MNQDLRDLLVSWDVEEEYISNFEREKIRKISTLKLLTETSLLRLFPEEGPRLEFSGHLKSYKEQLDNNSNIIFLASSSGLQKVTGPSETLPDVIMDGEEAAPPPMSAVQESQASPVPAPTPNQPEALRPNIQSSEVGRSNVTAAKHQCLEDLDPGDENFDLEKHLFKSLNGKLVLSYFKEHKELTDRHRNLLGDVLISEYLKDNTSKRMPYEIEKAITAHILKLFPNERQEVWLSPNPNKREKAIGRGKLVIRYYHIRRVMLKNHLLQRHSKEQSSRGLPEDLYDDDSSLNLTEEQNAELQDAIVWLQNNKQPWAKVFKLWQDTAVKRIRELTGSDLQIHQYMLKYPPLSDPQGFILIESDFEVLFPTSSVKLFSAWPMLSEFILNKVPKNVKDEIESSLTPEGRKLRTLRAIPYLFPVLTAIKKGKKQWRPSRLECQEALVLHEMDQGSMQPSLATRRKKYEEYGLQLGPQAVMIGQDEDNISTAYLAINNILYEVENAFKAFDLAFKSFHSLDAEYNKEIFRESLFLQIAVYEIPQKRGERAPDAKTAGLIEEYKKFISS